MTRSVRVSSAVVLLLLTSTLCIAQEAADTEKSPIKASKKGLGYRYTYEAKPLVSWNDFFLVMADSPQSLVQLKKARTSGTVSSVLSAAGGALVGWPIGEALVGGDPLWGLAIAGGGLVAVGVVFSARSANGLKKAVDTYNGSLALRDVNSKDLRIVFASTGIYVSVKL